MRRLTALVLSLLLLVSALPGLAETATEAGPAIEPEWIAGVLEDASMHNLTIHCATESCHDIALVDETTYVNDDEGLSLGKFLLVTYTGTLDDGAAATTVTVLNHAIARIGTLTDDALTAKGDTEDFTFALTDNVGIWGADALVEGEDVLLVYNGAPADNDLRLVVTESSITGKVVSVEDMYITIDAEETNYTFSLDGAKLPRLNAGEEVCVRFFGRLEMDEDEQFAVVHEVEGKEEPKPTPKPTPVPVKEKGLVGTVLAVSGKSITVMSGHGHKLTLTITKRTSIAKTIYEGDDVKIYYTGTVHTSKEKQPDASVRRIVVTESKKHKDKQSHKLVGKITDASMHSLTIKVGKGKTYTFMMDDKTYLTGKHKKKGLVIGEKVAVHFHGTLVTGKRSQDITLTHIEVM